MNLLFQLTVFSFVAFSFLLVIGVPVVFAGNYGKSTLYTGIGFWFFLVFAIGILNSFVV
uniref:Photosystem II reaction center protein Z n=1 Tax=Halimeda micronesica TaxID=170426 RepID=A0A386AXG3_9CHLO|nr:photosystem II protein Z [Halimeda micronesica]